MHTGFKTFFKKKLRDFLRTGMTQTSFPTLPVSRFFLTSRLLQLRTELKRSPTKYNLGTLWTPPSRFVSRIYGLFLSFNTNHLGNWSTASPEFNSTQQLEYEVIQKMIDLYQAKNEALEGYVSSGGTEGNIYSLWAGKSALLQSCSRDQLALLTTSFTHFSIRKGGNICDVPLFSIPLDQKKWNINSNGLIRLVKKLYDQGFRGFLLPLTIGYTVTGTTDNLAEVLTTVKNLQQSYPSIYFYVWIDAAFNGLIEPFINDSFAPFSSPLIQALVVDFHKFGLVPYAAGVVLFRKQLRQYIEQPIAYLDQSDTTLLGSRSGAASVAIWTAIQLFGKERYRELVKTQLKNKHFFIREIQSTFPDATIINQPKSLTCGVIFNSLKNQRLPSEIEKKYWTYAGKIQTLFYPNKIEELTIYKFFFMPHLKKEVLTEFFVDCKKFLKNNK